MKLKNKIRQFFDNWRIFIQEERRYKYRYEDNRKWSKHRIFYTLLTYGTILILIIIFAILMNLIIK